MPNTSIFGDPRSALQQFDHLFQAIIDTSSLIYLQEIALLAETSQWIRLFTIPGVIREFGTEEVECPIRIIDITNRKDCADSTDEMLFRTAVGFRLPIISEDRQILMRARKANLPYFNTLMVLNFLLYKNALNLLEYQSALDRLKATARYSDEIYEFGGQVFAEIRRGKGYDPGQGAD
ncbi:MAG: hypothetical protein U5L07_18450 [Desulfobacterales bacterium]|nr:hypothetical protein [Desulfobacterales bacterium]